MIKNILIIALNENWTGISRLPSGLERAGFESYALCPKNSYLAKTKYLKASIKYPTFSYSRSKLIYLWMVYAFWLYRPDMVIPGDEDALLALQNLANRLERVPYLNFISKIVRKSLPAKEHDFLLLSKSELQKKCFEWGLRTPKNIIVTDLSAALHSAKELGYPLVIKHDAGYGGSGVFICKDDADVREHFQKIKHVSLLVEIKEKIKNLFFISIFSNEKNISLQQFIEGQVGQAPFCAQEGDVFAFNPMVRIKTYPGSTGPASVSAGIKNVDIEHFVRTVAGNLKYTGFGSLEYIINLHDGLLYIIELNPRPTPTCHMSNQVVTNDLCEMFYKGLNGQALTYKDYTPYTVAMFPGEKRRDPQSEFLKSAFHDVPLDDPKLLEALNK